MGQNAKKMGMSKGYLHCCQSDSTAEALPTIRANAAVVEYNIVCENLGEIVRSQRCSNVEFRVCNAQPPYIAVALKRCVGNATRASVFAKCV
jgi:hypothetical protein